MINLEQATSMKIVFQNATLNKDPRFKISELVVDNCDLSDEAFE